jgi:uncharacterized protein (DUF885 family)
MTDIPTTADGHDAFVTDLADRFWEGLLRLEPFIGTVVGDERYDDRLPDPSESGRAEQRDFFAGIRDEAGAVDISELDLDLRTTVDIMDTVAKRTVIELDARVDRLQAVSHLFGPGNLLAQLGSIQRSDTPERVDRYVRRLEGFPEYLRRVGDLARAGLRESLVAPSLVVDRSIGQVERLLAMDPAESPGMTPVTRGPDDARRRVADALREHVWPAYQEYLETLREYRPHARDTIGLLALPDGDRLYRVLLQSHTTLELEPQQVHDTGVRELEEIQDQRRRIAQRLGHPDAETAIAEYTETGRNTASSRKEMLEVVRSQVERSWDAAPRFFGRLPEANCDVRPVEEFRENDMPGAYYMPGTPDGSRPGVYYVNTGHLEGRPLHATATTSFHEANPGHHFQITIQFEFPGRLRVRRFGGEMVGDAFTEGWGLYSERLADEMGLFLDDYERLGMLEADAFRAARCVVDTGIHALGWDRERAVEQMMTTGSSRVDSEIEVDRYVTMAGQACAYKLGQLEISRWRRDAERHLGQAFSLREFHDRLLALGSLPLRTLERELADGQAAPAG